jgi:hypothetical protein
MKLVRFSILVSVLSQPNSRNCPRLPYGRVNVNQS